jgi:long-chain acyl-CoA synthetase
MVETESNLKSMALLLCATPLFLLDVLFYLLSSLTWLRRMITPKRMQSVAVGPATATHGAPRRSAMAPGHLVTGEMDTIYDMIRIATDKYGALPAMVSRTFVEMKKIKETDRFPSKIFDDSTFHEISYEALGRAVRKVGAGLRALGMEPIPQLKTGETFDDLKGSFVMVIFEDTCQEWTIALQGAFSQSMCVATCYATLGTDAVVSAVNETAATTLLLNWKNAEKFAELASKMPTLKTIIASTHEMPAGTPTPKPPSGVTVQIVSSDDVLELGAKNLEAFPPVPPQPTDVAVIMYTSGSTGKPKGVVMTHEQLVSGVSGMAMNVKLRVGKEVFMSYLPLAHILALQIQNYLLYAGAKVCFSDPRELPHAMPLFKPTVFAGVPKVWDIIKDSTEKKIAKAGPVKSVFDTLMTWKRFALKHGLDTPVSNIFFKFISNKVFGGVLQFGVSGGGPMTASLHDFCRAIFCCPIIQGYALTETCVGGCFQAIDDPRSSVVGPPVPCVEIMVQSEPDIKDGGGLPYLYTDKVGSKGEPVLGRGEICMRGPCVSSGYYKLPDKTKEEFDEEGWFHTGDIGQFTDDGVIQIVDRKKNLVKLRGGEYVAVESMESAFAVSPFVAAVCVVANGDLDTPLACVNVNVAYLKTWASNNNVSYDSITNLAEKDETRMAVVKSMVAAGKEAGLTSLELRIKDCFLVAEEWGPGHGMTASMKIDRKQVLSIYEKELQAMLKRNGVHA